MKLDRLSLKGLKEAPVGSDTCRHIGIPPSPTTLTVPFCVFKLVDVVGFKVESEPLKTNKSFL